MNKVFRKFLKSKKVPLVSGLSLSISFLVIIGAQVSYKVIDSKVIRPGPVVTSESEISISTQKVVNKLVCNSVFGQKVCTKTPRVVVHKLPVIKLEISHPTNIQLGDTGEILITPVFIKKNNDIDGKKGGMSAVETVSVSFIASSFDFLPKLPLAFENNSVIPQYVIFEAKSVGNKKINVRSEMLVKVVGTEKEEVKKVLGANSALAIEVMPLPVVLGMSESTLKGVQLLSAAIGLPALMLLLLSMYIKKREKTSDKVKEGSNIILP